MALVFLRQSDGQQSNVSDVASHDCQRIVEEPSFLGYMRLLVICVVGIVAALRSKVLPRAAIRLAVSGFTCVFAYAVLSGFFQYWYTAISVTRSESPASLAMQIWAVETLKVVLLATGIAVIGRAVFSGRQNEN